MSAATVPASFAVASARQETEDTWTLDLNAEAGEPLSFAPGQFTMLYVFGVGEVPISVSGDPAEPQTLVHTVRAVGAVTRAVCTAAAGDRLGVRGPFGSAWPRPEQGSDVVFVAGGLGLAPLRPAIYAALGERERYGRVIVLYGGRTPDQLLYRGAARPLARGRRARTRAHRGRGRAGLARTGRGRAGTARPGPDRP